tara:strand:+ start:98 stop:607 length:510 start_codon:yes stop_codon:yes gene_type:complete
MTAFDQAWDIAKDFYLGQNHPHEEGGFHQRWPPETFAGPVGSHNVRSKEGEGGPYWSGANIAHPIYQYEDWLPPEGEEPDWHIPRQRLDEDEMVRRIIQTLVHEEGHEAILNPLEAEAHEDFFNSEDMNALYSRDFAPNNQVQEHGAMLIEGLSNPEIRAEMQRRRFFG